MRTFQEARAELADLRVRWLNGEPVGDQMNAVAAEATALYNAAARAAAKRMGQKPRLTTPDRLMKTCRVGL